MEENKKTNKNKMSINKLLIPAVIAAFIIVGWFVYQTNFVAATVNGNIISRFELIKLLEKQGGKQVLESLITEKLIDQEAKKQNITVDPADVDAEIEKIKSNITQQGQNFEEILAMQNLKLSDLKDQIKMQLLVEKMALQDTDITEEEVNNYIENNKEYFEGEDTESEEFREGVKEDIKSQNSQNQMQNFINDLKSKADIKYLIEY